VPGRLLWDHRRADGVRFRLTWDQPRTRAARVAKPAERPPAIWMPPVAVWLLKGACPIWPWRPRANWPAAKALGPPLAANGRAETGVAVVTAEVVAGAGVAIATTSAGVSVASAAAVDVAVVGVTGVAVVGVTGVAVVVASAGGLGFVG